MTKGRAHAPDNYNKIQKSVTQPTYILSGTDMFSPFVWIIRDLTCVSNLFKITCDIDASHKYNKNHVCMIIKFIHGMLH